MELDKEHKQSLNVDFGIRNIQTYENKMFTSNDVFMNECILE